MNIKLYLQFDGTNYNGWQIQPDKPTVQGILKDAFFKITGEDVMPKGSSRTDSGVHAKGYVANVHTNTNIPCDRLVYALNTVLPPDIVCYASGEVDEDFCASRSAKMKTYRYTIDNGEFKNVFLDRFAWHYKYPLDTEKMQSAAKQFIGTHDFSGFASSGYTVKTTVRTIYSLKIEKTGNTITIDVTGDGFLYNMVRIIVGTLVYVGSGKIAPDDITDIINSTDRRRAGITAPAKGLCLKEVFY